MRMSSENQELVDFLTSMKKISIALILGILAGSALAISAGIQQSFTADTVLVSAQKEAAAIHLTPQEAHELIQTSRTNPNFVILDVRTPGEFSEGQLANAINIDFYADTFRQEMNQLEREKTYLVYCRRGVRSDRTLPMMQEMGFQRVYNLLWGTTRLQREGFPTVR
jgi:rhodanese-related sulfurtransferase